MVLEPRVEAGCRRLSLCRSQRAGRAAPFVERRNRNPVRAGCPNDFAPARRGSLDSGGCFITPLLSGVSSGRSGSLFPQRVANGVLAGVPPSRRALACRMSSLPGTAHSGIAWTSMRRRSGVARIAGPTCGNILSWPNHESLARFSIGNDGYGVWCRAAKRDFKGLCRQPRFPERDSHRGCNGAAWRRCDARFGS